MTCSFVWVLRHLLCSYCVPGKSRKQHSACVSHCSKPLPPPSVSAHVTFTTTQEGVHLLTPWTVEETEAQEVA